MAGYKPELIPQNQMVDLTNRMSVKPQSSKKLAKTIEKRYEKLATKRQPFLERARMFSRYTLPNLYPYIETNMGDYGDGANTTGWQSFGAECANTITNKLVMTLFPPHSSFARLDLTPRAKQTLHEDDIKYIDAESMLTNAEKEAMMEHERIAGRVGLGQALEHLVVGGTTCLYLPDNDESSLINYPLTNFVSRRDKSGFLLELIIEEQKSIDTFEPAIQMLIKAKKKSHQSRVKDSETRDDEVKLYTRMLFKNGFYRIEQEVVGERVGESYRVKPENSPFIVLRWKSNYGEDYGRSLVEQYASDFHVIQLLSEAIAKGMVLMADVKYLIRPGSVTDVDHLIESPTGEFIYGNIDDIGVLQLEKHADFTPIANVLDKYERRVGRAFMLGSQVQRNAERVTAYEIRRDALEMEQNLGGAYSLLANTLQRPYFRLLLKRIDFSLPEGIVSTVLLTGIEALSKMSDADKFFQWSEAMATAAGLPPKIQDRMKWGDYAQHSANQLSLDLPFIMTEDEYREYSAEQRQNQQQDMLMQGAASAMPQVANNLTKPE